MLYTNTHENGHITRGARPGLGAQCFYWSSVIHCPHGWPSIFSSSRDQANTFSLQSLQRQTDTTTSTKGPKANHIVWLCLHRIGRQNEQQKARTIKTTGKMYFIKIKNCALWKIPLRKWKEKPETRRNYFEYVYLTKGLYPEYTKNSCNSKIRYITWISNGQNIQTDFSQKKI